MPGRPARNLASQLLLTWLATSICLAAAESVAQTPKPTVDYRVGRTLLHWVDQERTDTVMEGEPKREMTAVVWYPADAGAKMPAPAPWMPGVFVEGQVNSTVRERRRSANPLTPEQARKIVTATQSRSFENVPLAGERTTYPLLLFEPGSGINPAFYSSFCEDLASQGYVVVGISPTGL
jgi:hypothetical protein